MENTFKGTDKEWSFEYHEYHKEYLVIDPDGYGIAAVPDDMGDEAKANAQLIIHALPMLSRLEGIVKKWDSLKNNTDSYQNPNAQLGYWLYTFIAPEIDKARELIKSATTIK